MSVIIGIDVGGSTTKIVGYSHEEKLVSMLKVEAADPLTSAYGALGKFINENGLSLKDVKQIILTGVGASLFKKDIYGIPTSTVDEFKAIGLGGLALSGKKEGLIVSMGTGTAFVRAGAGGIRHIHQTHSCHLERQQHDVCGLQHRAPDYPGCQTRFGIRLAQTESS